MRSSPPPASLPSPYDTSPLAPQNVTSTATPTHRYGGRRAQTSTCHGRTGPKRRVRSSERSSPSAGADRPSTDRPREDAVPRLWLRPARLIRHDTRSRATPRQSKPAGKGRRDGRGRRPTAPVPAPPRSPRQPGGSPPPDPRAAQSHRQPGPRSAPERQGRTTPAAQARRRPMSPSGARRQVPRLLRPPRPVRAGGQQYPATDC
ncbi:hypothetical protein L083_1268 [Actinoplanes sp. N902-109]|nr:hypothetical protein L083_1268 [Actinoplanes sp. N902-109]